MEARILSISYDAGLLRTRRHLLEQAGYSVTSAEGFVQALECCKAGDYELVAMGHSIPHQDKVALLKAISEGCEAPVIALLRPGEPPLPGAAQSVESINPNAFLAAVRKVLERQSEFT